MKRRGYPLKGSLIQYGGTSAHAGERTDTVTYVVNRSGRFKLPPVTIEWWNTTTQRREKIVLPAVSFSGAAAIEKPLSAIPIDALSKGGAHRIIVIDRSRALIAALTLVFLFALIWAYPRLATRYKLAKRALVDARNRYAEGETLAWRALRAAASKGSLQRIIPALYRCIAGWTRAPISSIQRE
jgi:hypothetical protein